MVISLKMFTSINAPDFHFFSSKCNVVSARQVLGHRFVFVLKFKIKSRLQLKGLGRSAESSMTNFDFKMVPVKKYYNPVVFYSASSILKGTIPG